MSLIPCFEHMIKRLGEVAQEPLPDDVLQIIQSIANFIELLYESTQNLSSGRIKAINRHVLAHALEDGVIEEIEENDFFRFITLLNALIFCSSFTGGEGSIFSPGETAESKSLVAQLILCSGISPLIKN